MLGNPFLEVAIALAFFYVLLSLVCTSLTEAVSSVISLRARTLRAAIVNLWCGDDSSETADKLLEHPLIKGSVVERRFAGSASRVPDYIPPRTFALALLETLAPPKAGSTTNLAVDPRAPNSFEELSKLLDENKSLALRRSLRTIIHGSGSLSDAQGRIEAWYDQMMDRVRGRYARRVQWVTVCAAIVVAGMMNADTIMIANELWKDSSLRAYIVAQAEQAAEGGSVQLSTEEARKLLVDFPIGWVSGSEFKGDPRSFPEAWTARALKGAGLLVTIFAISLGAPFWFDLLNRLVNIRSTGKPIPTAADKEAAKRA
jgi:hypothetical protein